MAYYRWLASRLLLRVFFLLAAEKSPERSKTSVQFGSFGSQLHAVRHDPVLQQIIYNENSINFPTSQRKKAILLHNPPKCIIVELIEWSPGPYEGLPPNLSYPTRLCANLLATRWHQDSKWFQRVQLPLTPAFAFTDYKCQGWTLGKVIVDLTAKGGNNSAYVMLSRVQRLEDLLILRPFKESVLDIKLPSKTSRRN
jgi:hypothetical protein